MKTDKTEEECLKNNNDSLDNSRGSERSIRIKFRDDFAKGEITEKDFKLYRKHMWNKKAEKRKND